MKRPKKHEFSVSVNLPLGKRGVQRYIVDIPHRRVKDGISVDSVTVTAIKGKK